MQDDGKPGRIDWRVFWSGIGIGLGICGALALILASDNSRYYQHIYAESAVSPSTITRFGFSIGETALDALAACAALWPIITGIFHRRIFSVLWFVILANGLAIGLIGGMLLAANYQGLSEQFMLLGD